MSYSLATVQGAIGNILAAAPRYYSFGITAAESMQLHCQVKVTAVSGGVGVGNPAVLSLEHTWDDGATWSVIPSLAADEISAAGIFTVSVTAASGIVSPFVRLKISPPVGESITISSVRRTRLVPGDVPASRPAGSSAGANVLCYGANFINNADTKIAVSPAGGMLVSQWPYTAWDNVTEAWDAVAFTDTFTYLLAAVTVGTIVVTYTDATQSQMVSTAYSPARRA